MAERERTSPPTAFRTVDEKSYEDNDGGSSPLLRRSKALGMVLVVLLVGMVACLLGLLLHKRERR